MNWLSNTFFSSIVWNTVESVLYYCLFFGHQLALFSCMSPAEYGKAGTVFSLIYLTVSIIDFGFEPFLMLLLERLRLSKQMFISCLQSHSIPSVIACAALPSLALIASYVYTPPISYTLIIALVISEYARKLLKSLLQLFFFHRIAALMEVGMLICYVSIVWGIYAFAGFLGIYDLFIPLLFTSLGTTTLFFFIVYTNIYATLPIANGSSVDNAFPLQNRFYLYVSNLSTQIFSSNFLVPFLAIHRGFEQAGLFKLLSAAIHTISIAIHKIFGTAGKVYLAHSLLTKETQQAFDILHSLTHKTLTYISVAATCMIFCAPTSSAWAPLLIWYATLTFIDTITVAHDKLYPFNRSANLLCIINSITIALMIIAMYVPTQSLTTVLISTLAIRLVSSITIILVARKRWNAPIPWKSGILGLLTTTIAVYCILLNLI